MRDRSNRNHMLIRENGDAVADRMKRIEIVGDQENGEIESLLERADQLVRGLKERLGLTVFLITHDLDTLHAVCDRIAVLADKRVIGVGTIPELLALDHPWIQEYFNGPRGRSAAGSYTEGVVA